MLFLAEASSILQIPISPDQAAQGLFFVQASAASVSLAVIAGAVFKGVEVFKQQPPARDLFATKAEVREMETRLSEQIAKLENHDSVGTQRVFDRIEGVDASIQRGLKDMERAVGRLEGANAVGEAIAKHLEQGMVQIGVQMVRAIKELPCSHDRGRR